MACTMIFVPFLSVPSFSSYFVGPSRTIILSAVTIASSDSFVFAHSTYGVGEGFFVAAGVGVAVAFVSMVRPLFST